MNSYFYFNLSAQYFCILHMWRKHTLAETMRQRMSPVTDCLSCTIIWWSEATFYVFHLYLHLFFICYLFVCCIYIYFYICIDCLSYATSWRSGCHVLCFPFVYQSYGLSNAVCSAVFLLKVLLDHIMQDSECFIVCNCNLITVRCCFLMYF